MHYRKLVIKIFTQKILTLIPFNPKNMRYNLFFIKCSSIITLVFLSLTGFAQTPVIPNKPISNNPVRNTKIQPVASNSGVDRYRKAEPQMLRALASQYSQLQYAYKLPTDPDCRGPQCFYWDWSTYYSHDITSDPATKNWTRNLMWRKIPSQAVYGRWEISLLPFPPGYDPSFSGIIRSGLIETHGSDSVYFILNYLDNANRQTGIEKRKGSLQPKTTFPTQKRDARSNKPAITEGPASGIKLNKDLLSKMQLPHDETRKFYIRLVPLDKDKKPLFKISNDVVVQETIWKPLTPVEKPIYIEDDYTITAVNYVPVYYGDPQYYACGIVAGYNGNPNDGLIKSFMAAFPPGTMICPQPAKDKSWYEKAFSGITGFIAKAIDGTAEFYNDTKNYLRKKFMEINCNANLVSSVVNPVTHLQEAAGPEVCELVSDAAFDYGMVAVGLPPTLPNTDELTKLAEGQVVDLACDKIESETGVPVPEATREGIRKEFHDNVMSSSNKGIVNNGFVRVKPHPLGLFRPAYLEIEVTRTGNAYKDKALAAIRISDVTTRTMEDWDKNAQKNVAVNLKGNLFEPSTAKVPYLENVGDKYKIYVVLKPQESYIWRDKKTGVIASVNHGQQPGEWYSTPVPTYEGLAYTGGFQLLNNGGSVTNFSLELKKAENVKTVFINP